jgi:hypothetical protein
VTGQGGAAFPIGHISPHARVLVLLIGVGLCGWVIGKIRNRTVLIPTCSLLLAIGAGILAFAAWPSFFDRLSNLVGIAYPPVFYFLFAFIGLFLVVLHLATRLSITDERCRKLSQEIALLKAEREEAARRDSGESATGR